MNLEESGQSKPETMDRQTSVGTVEIKDDSSQLVGVKSTCLDEQLRKKDVDQGPDNLQPPQLPLHAMIT